MRLFCILSRVTGLQNPRVYVDKSFEAAYVAQGVARQQLETAQSTGHQGTATQAFCSMLRSSSDVWSNLEALNVTHGL